MDRTNYARSIVGALAVVAVLVLVGTGSAAADLTDSNETVEIEDQNDTVIVDVEFDDSFINSTTYNGSTYADLNLYDENGTLVKSANITVDESNLNTTQIAVDSDTAWFSESFTGFKQSAVGNITVELADSGQGINDTAVSVDSGGLFGGSGILGGATQTQVLAGVVVIVLGLIAFRRIDG